MFGTSEDLSGAKNTQSQDKVSAYMQHAWKAFARDPTGGLGNLGWPMYAGKGTKTLVRLGYGEEVEASHVQPEGADEVCGELGFVI